MKGYKKVNLMLIGNTLNFQKQDNIFRVYDLKGSTFKRLVKVDSNSKPSTTLKDMNFLNNNHDF